MSSLALARPACDEEFEGRFEFQDVEVQIAGWRLYGLSFSLRAFFLEHSPPDEIPAFALV